MSCPSDAPKKTAHDLSSSGHPISGQLPSLREVRTKVAAGAALDLCDVSALASTKTGLQIAFQMVRDGYRFSLQHIQVLGNPRDDEDRTLMHRMAERGLFFTIDELLVMGNPGNNFGYTVAHEQAKRGFVFSPDDLVRLGNPLAVSSHGTVGHVMVAQGHRFSLDGLVTLGYPQNGLGRTIAHAMVARGNRLETGELLALGNPVDNTGRSLAEIAFQYLPQVDGMALARIGDWTLIWRAAGGRLDPAHYCAARGEMNYKDFLLEPGNRPDQLIGWTPAFYAARNGMRFSQAEVARLGNSRAIDGSQIWHAMARAGTRLSLEELKQIGNPPDDFGWTPAHLLIALNRTQFTPLEIQALGNSATKEGYVLSDLAQWRGVITPEENAMLKDPDAATAARAAAAGQPVPAEIFLRRPELAIQYGLFE